MTLSVLIPTYNYNARELVTSMLQRINSEGIEGEVVVSDDASIVPMEWLDEIALLPQVRVLRSPTNLGRARNLNRLAEAAQGEWLLITDCDARMEDDFSLQTYLEVGKRAPVVCGGLRHPEINPCPEATLRYAYEREADKRRSAATRMQHPYHQLSTFNLLVDRATFLKIRFDEACTEYGYEDTLFGADLESHEIAILHIDNPLVHEGMEPNDAYLKKTETALHTLHQLDKKMQGHSTLLDTANKLRKWHLQGFVAFLFSLFRGPLRKNLLGKRPNLTAFKLYKLGYFMTLKGN